MHYFALYQTVFKGMARPLQVGSHALVGSLTAANLEEAYCDLQAESMCGVLAERIAANPSVAHTSASLGDILVPEDGCGFMVDLFGFKLLRLESSAGRAEYDLHLMSMRLERSPGWDALFREDAAAMTAVLVERLRHDTLGLFDHARHPLRPRFAPLGVQPEA